MGEPKKVNVLGSKWSIIRSNPTVYPGLKDCDGYCDPTSHEIILDPLTDDERSADIGNYEAHNKRVIRHEIVHAFLFESGLADDAGWPRNEAMVDWIARQFPKLSQAFQEAGAL